MARDRETPDKRNEGTATIDERSDARRLQDARDLAPKAMRFINTADTEESRRELTELTRLGNAVRGLAPKERHEQIEHYTALCVASSLAPSKVEYISGGRTDVFSRLNADEKTALLTHAEKRLAAFEGRSPCLVGNFGGSLALAAYNPNQHTLMFNRDVLNHPKVGTEFVLSTFFHESTHRLQQDVMRNPLAYPYYSEKTVGGWMDNARAGCYIDPGELGSERWAYESQPAERFANDRTRELMRRVYELFGVQDS